MNRTKNLITIAAVLMQDPGGRHHGYDLQTKASIRSGAMYPLLRRLLEEGWLEDGWEDPAEVHGRPPRRYYALTELGMRELGALAVRAPNSAPAARSFGLREGFAR